MDRIQVKIIVEFQALLRKLNPDFFKRATNPLIQQAVQACCSADLENLSNKVRTDWQKIAGNIFKDETGTRPDGINIKAQSWQYEAIPLLVLSALINNQIKRAIDLMRVFVVSYRCLVHKSLSVVVISGCPWITLRVKTNRFLQLERLMFQLEDAADSIELYTNSYPQE